MQALFANIQAVVRKKLNKVNISHAVFRLHYNLTFILMLISCVLVTARQYIGEHISCIHDTVGKDGQYDKVINNYCFITPTFSIPGEYKKKTGSETAYMGLGPVKENEDVVHHAYYQWVPFVLFFQALMFYVPHFLWKALEGGKVKAIIQDLNVFNVQKLGSRGKTIDTLTEYLMKTLHEHNWWAIKFFFCEILNLVNVIAQIYITDAFLGGEFLRYGIEVFNFLNQDPEDRIDPMARVFPRVTKCTFRKYGFSGTVQTADAFCVLALNIINEKIYAFLWFWFVILAVITGAHFLFRIATLFFSSARAAILRTFTGAGARNDINTVIDKVQFGDWLLLDFLGINMDGMTFKSVIESLAGKLDRRPVIVHDVNSKLLDETET